MQKSFFDELHKMSHEDEMRSKVLMHGLKRMLDEKKEQTLVDKLFKKKHKVQPHGWNKAL
ncbi:hypothetical protein B5M42_003225 [Paenibacillus athensensis]|uniref:Uncharacterized protein n=1 Tax=Paenibacillus athensensis TaxID=1967502 RepID=A0A4Y8PWT1_9BACL|nr:hypothetical protein [Paenibacillus athensensis]MCD1257851.1 hypothetical protein [Paenibacillus athensensis]